MRDSDQIGTPILPDTPFPNISNLLISEGGILKLLKGLDISKASGSDQIPNKILRELAIHLAPVLISLFNQSLLSETLPSDWKTANVTQVFKKVNRSLASNYRPIPLVCVACKLLEHCIVSHVMQHFDQHNILTPLQKKNIVVSPNRECALHNHSDIWRLRSRLPVQM